MARRAALKSGTKSSLLENADLESFIPEARPFIKKAVEDVASVPGHNLETIAKIIVNRAWEDEQYPQIGAALCSHICKQERESQKHFCTVPIYKFQNGVVNHCVVLMADYKAMRDTKLSYWLSFIRLLIELYLQIRPGGFSLGGLTNLLYQSLDILTSAASLQNFDEVEVLCSVFYECGEKLQMDDKHHMSVLINRLRDTFLDPELDQGTTGLLLPLIELYASNWQLSEEAQSFYFRC